jgi:predicted SAM-dependent methyltransferase
MGNTISHILRRQVILLLDVFFIRTIYRRFSRWNKNKNTAGGFNHYRKEKSIVKVTLGCGNSAKEGWFNTDIDVRPNVYYLDATRPFPFPDGSVDIIHTEHMIEHIDIFGGVNLMKESYRVLKKGGILRVVTPDLSFLVNMYLSPDEPLHKRYLQWASNNLYPQLYQEVSAHSPVFVFNNFVRDWGHQLIYDASSLAALSKFTGFETFKIFKSGDSETLELKTMGMPFPKNLIN